MTKSGIKLLVRADDMGSSWGANEGCIAACLNGIAGSVEVMMPCAWITGAADRLDHHLDIDVGIHLTLTSEWETFKWRPLTKAPSLVDENGHFFPLLVPMDGDPRPAHSNHEWSLNEAYEELRAQLTLARRLFPQASHISSHMTAHFRNFDPRMDQVVASLCREFDLMNDPLGSTIPILWPHPKAPPDAAAREATFLETVKSLQSGTYIIIDHPAVASDDMKSIGHPGYRDVAEDRQACLELFTSPTLRAALDRLGVELISYKDL